MEWEFIAPMVVASTLVLSVAGVLILRPLTTRLGNLIEATSRNRQTQLSGEEITRLTELVGSLADRIDRLEDRQDFTERILHSLERPAPRARLSEPQDS